MFAVQKWHQYAFARHVAVQSDHKPLEAIFTKPLASAPRRLQGMMLRLQGYNLTIKWTKGKDLVLADTLSRAYLQKVPSRQEEFETVNMVNFLPIRQERLAKLKERTSTDESLQKLKETIITGWPEDKNTLSTSVAAFFSFQR